MAELATCPNVSVKLGGMLNRGAALNFRELPAPPNSAAWAAAYGWCGDLAKIARRSNAACSPPTATRSPTRCPPKPCSPCPNSTACCRCPTRPRTPPPEARGGDAAPDHRSLREEREQF